MDVDSLWVELALSLEALQRVLTAFFPRVVAALLVLFVTTLLAWALRAIVRRVFRGFARRLPSADVPWRWGTLDGEAAARTVASAVFWLLLLGGVMVASEALGVRVLSRWLGAVADYIPNVVLAIVIGFGGVVGGRLAGAAIGRATVRWAPHQAQQLARLVQFALGLVAVLVAAGQLGIDVSLLTAVFLILLASTLGGIALAFGLGARGVVGNILAMHYVNKSYGIGQLVRVGEHQGRIVRTSATSVFLEHEEGEIAIFTALAVLLPVVAGQSGNAGAQALAVTMRGLALREIGVSHGPRVLLKEMSVGFINGLVIATVTALSVYVWSRSLGLASVMLLSMLCSMVAASAAGAAIPIILVKLGRDPATASSIILTTVTDIIGFLSFLGLAQVFARVVGGL